MMNKMSRAMLALASLGLSGAELRRLLMELRSLPIEEIVMQVQLLSEACERRSEIPFDEPRLRYGHRERYQSESTVGDRVERLLKIEANLSTQEAYEALSNAIVASGMLPKYEIPPLSRKSLHNWVDRLIQKLPAKEVLHLATNVRNEYVHSPMTDWTIGRSS